MKGLPQEKGKVKYRAPKFNALRQKWKDRDPEIATYQVRFFLAISHKITCSSFFSPFKEPRTCTLCFKVFNGHNMLHKHRAQEHELGDYACEVCTPNPTYHLTKWDLKIHQKVKAYGEIKHLRWLIDLFL